MSCQPTLRKRSCDKSQRKQRGSTHSNNLSTEDDQEDLGPSKKNSRTSSFVELPDLEEIERQAYRFSSDSEKESEDSSRPQSRLSHDDTPDNTSTDLPPDFSNDIINDSILNISEQNSSDSEYEFSLDPPLSPSEWKRLRTEQTLKHIEIILPVPQFQDY